VGIPLGQADTDSLKPRSALPLARWEAPCSVAALAARRDRRFAIVRAIDLAVARRALSQGSFLVLSLNSSACLLDRGICNRHVQRARQGVKAVGKYADI